MNKKVLISSLICLPLICSCTTPTTSSSSTNEYGSNYNVENTKANQDYLYGMCHLAWSEKSWEGIEYTPTTQMMKNMGVKSVRNWMHCNWVMKSPTEFDETSRALSHQILDDLLQYDYQIIGMNHSNFQLSGKRYKAETLKPARNLTEGSSYMKWLEDYKTTWYNLASEFPEIMYWEIDNEPNNDVFMANSSGGTFSLKQKALIYYDMMYFASLGIHEANPSAVTIMGGLIISNAETFLQYIYDAIYAEDSWSNYPDDYFQVACWHPYMDDFTPTKFEKANNDIYNVIKTNEGKDKKVFFTELGFSEANVSLNKINEYLPEVYRVIKEKLPYVESAHYFRMYDILGSTWGSSAEKQFGLFTDPTNHGAVDSQGNYQNPTLASPKITAYTYQEMAGGSGSLTIYEEFLKQTN